MTGAGGAMGKMGLGTGRGLCGGAWGVCGRKLTQVAGADPVFAGAGVVWGGTQASTAPGAFGGGPVGVELEAGVELGGGVGPNRVVSEGALVVLGCFAFDSPTGLALALAGVAQTMSDCPRCCCEALARGTGDLGTDGSLRVALALPRVAEDDEA